MKFETVALSALSLDPSNVRKHSRRNLDAIKASLRKFGQQKPIVVDAKGIVLAGNGTLTAAKELSWTEIQIVRTDLAGVEATAFAIADNRTSELAEWDEKLRDVLESLKAEDYPLDEIGFDENELGALTGDKVEDHEAEWKEMPEFKQDEKPPHREIIVRFSSEGDFIKFAKLIEQNLTEKTLSIWFPKQDQDQFNRDFVYAVKEGEK
jgi:ParB-like chromosome segregation protein Spo0J